MQGYFSTSNLASFNLATEEFFLKHTEWDVLFLYIDAPSVIVGKHQNALAEINHSFAYQHQIPVYRRMSGGGTVFHDWGNLNFSFIISGQPGHLVDFKRHLSPIVNLLNELAIPVELGIRNDILVKGKKISGNASHVYKNRVLHHGTILVNSNLEMIREVLKNNPAKYNDKAVKSVRSLVTNIASYLPDTFSINHLKDLLLEKLAGQSIKLSEDHHRIIENLQSTKYETWEWNYGYSPDYQLSKRISIESFHMVITLMVRKGIVTETDIQSNQHQSLLNGIFEKIKHQRHEYQVLMQILRPELSGFFSPLQIESLLDQLF